MSHLAFVFPGQGSQSVGMLDAWAHEHAIVRDTLEEADSALGMDLSGLIRQGPAEQLNQTINTQPAMLAADVAIWRAWCAAGGARPSVVAGHSLGEYAALVASEVLDFPAALRLVRERARLMQEAVPAGQGAMAAVIGLDDEAVIALCAEQAQGEVLEAVNFNAPGQVVVAGTAGAIKRLLDQAKAAGARMARSLPVSVPAHSALMQPAAEGLAACMADLAWGPPRIPLLHNIDAAPRDQCPAIQDALARQVARPVQWVRTLQRMADDYAIVAGYECGPGNVLCGLAKRGLKGVPFRSLAQPEQLNAALEASDA